jgi:hypothetical protein
VRTASVFVATAMNTDIWHTHETTKAWAGWLAGWLNSTRVLHSVRTLPLRSVLRATHTTLHMCRTYTHTHSWPSLKLTPVTQRCRR